MKHCKSDQSPFKNEIIQKDAFEKLFQTEDGKSVLTVLYKLCMPSIGEYESDTHKAAFNEGQRSVLMQILKLANISKDVFFQEAIKDYETMKKECFNNQPNFIDWR